MRVKECLMLANMIQECMQTKRQKRDGAAVNVSRRVAGEDVSDE